MRYERRERRDARSRFDPSTLSFDRPTNRPTNLPTIIAFLGTETEKRGLATRRETRRRAED